MVNEISGCWFGTCFMTFHILEMSSSQLTSSYFSEGLNPPTRNPVSTPVNRTTETVGSRAATALSFSASLFAWKKHSDDSIRCNGFMEDWHKACESASWFSQWQGPCRILFGDASLSTGNHRLNWNTVKFMGLEGDKTPTVLAIYQL